MSTCPQHSTRHLYVLSPSALNGGRRKATHLWLLVVCLPEPGDTQKKKTYHSRVRINAHKQLHAQANLAHHAAMALEDMSRL
jgi:hypothetical protein